eukprot:6489449-Amphidinium_carterae.1
MLSKLFDSVGTCPGSPCGVAEGAAEQCLALSSPSHPWRVVECVAIGWSYFARVVQAKKLWGTNSKPT